MRIIFMGTPTFAVPALLALHEAHDVVAVLTQPDRPRGRGREPIATPIKKSALELDLPIIQPETLRAPEIHNQLRGLDPDVICVAAYGQILPIEVLEIPRHGCLNIHATILPRFRGAAPVHRAILSGDEVTGVSIMRMEEGLDTGPVARVAEIDVGLASVEELTQALAVAGAEVLLDVLGDITNENVTWSPQEVELATYAEKITADDVSLSPELTLEDASRRVRVSTRSARSRISLGDDAIEVLEISSMPDTRLDPGAIEVRKDALLIGLADGVAKLELLKPPGRGSMDGASFARGSRLGSEVSWSRAR